MSSLTRRQRQILALMFVDDGPTYFAGGTRSFGVGRPKDDHPGSLVVHAYQEPEMFLEHRGLIAAVPMNAPGRWFRLSDKGRDVAGKFREDTLEEARARLARLS